MQNWLNVKWYNIISGIYKNSNGILNCHVFYKAQLFKIIHSTMPYIFSNVITKRRLYINPEHISGIEREIPRTVF